VRRESPRETGAAFVFYAGGNDAPSRWRAEGRSGAGGYGRKVGHGRQGARAPRRGKLPPGLPPNVLARDEIRWYGLPGRGLETMIKSKKLTPDGLRDTAYKGFETRPLQASRFVVTRLTALRGPAAVRAAIIEIPPRRAGYGAIVGFPVPE
jgi:hypothetical protein